jgi:hypothetical protein
VTDLLTWSCVRPQRQGTLTGGMLGLARTRAHEHEDFHLHDRSAARLCRGTTAVVVVSEAPDAPSGCRGRYRHRGRIPGNRPTARPLPRAGLTHPPRPHRINCDYGTEVWVGDRYRYRYRPRWCGLPSTRQISGSPVPWNHCRCRGQRGARRAERLSLSWSNHGRSEGFGCVVGTRCRPR